LDELERAARVRAKVFLLPPPSPSFLFSLSLSPLLLLTRVFAPLQLLESEPAEAAAEEKKEAAPAANQKAQPKKDMRQRSADEDDKNLYLFGALCAFAAAGLGVLYIMRGKK